MSHREPAGYEQHRGDIRFQRPPLLPLLGVDIEPEVLLIRWDFVSVDVPETVGWFLIGIQLEGSIREAECATRRSTPITAFDPDTRIALTRSGRRYVLVGPPGNQEPRVMDHWRGTVRRLAIPADEWSVVTAQALSGQLPPTITAGAAPVE